MKTLSFLDLFIKEKLGIEIPMLQRDYAQGREDANAKKIRERFLDTLTSALEGAPVVLDFIYGSVENGKFYPLDGQQRLTTLFLLHGYVAAREDRVEEFLRYLRSDEGSRFSYTTRFSSRDFCGKFVDCLVGEKLLLRGQPDQSLRSWIEDQGWFQYSWKGDPTIAAMLVMLDAIHERLKGRQGRCWPRLTGEDAKPVAIQFHFLELKDFKLRDELYIKMNARGKPLTEFENLKAYFLSILDKVVQRQEFEERFAQKFDNDWTDIFWTLCDKDKGLGVDGVDSFFLQYARYLTDMFRFSHKIEIESGAKQDDFKVWNAVYGPDSDLGKEARRWLFDALDCWNVEKIPDVSGFFNIVFSPSGYEAGKIWLNNNDVDLFSRCCREYGSSNFTLGDSLLLYAILCRLVSSDKPCKKEDKVFYALRSVRNLIWNQDSLRLDEMPRLLSVVEKIMESGVLQENESFAPFTEYQIKEEQAKAEFLEKNPEYRETVHQLEDHPLLRGRIAALFDTDKKEFIVKPNCALTFLRLFPHKQAEGPSRAQSARALLAVGDYAQALTAGRWQFGPGNEDHEDYWRALLTRQERAEFENTRKCLCALLKEISETSGSGDMVMCLDRQVNEYLKLAEKEKKFDWRYYFVKYYDTMCAGSSGFYYCGGKNGFFDVSMLDKTQRNGYYCDPYLWTLLKKVLPDKESPWDVDTEIIENFWIHGGDKGWMSLVEAGVEMRCDPEGKGFRFKATNEQGQARLDQLRQSDEWGKIKDGDGGTNDHEESGLLVAISGKDKNRDKENYDTEDRIEIGVELVRRFLEL